MWLALAVVVIALIAWLWSSTRRRQEADQRAQAAALRAQVEERLTTVQDQEDRASVTERIAADAQAEAEAQAAEVRRAAAAAAEREAEARRLAEQAEANRAEARAVREEHERLAREADLLDPDVATDSDGYRVDDTGHRLDGSDRARPGAEPDVESEAAPVGTKRVAEQPGTSSQVDADSSVAPTEASDEEAVPMEDVTDDTARQTGPGETEETPEEPATEERATEERADYRFSSGDEQDEAVVTIPALEDRDEVVVGGGTPADDPGDQRGQPWSTSPGAPGPDPKDEEPGAGYGEDAALGARVDPETDVEVGDPTANPGPVEHSDDAPLLDDSAGTDEGDRDEGDREGSSAHNASGDAEAGDGTTGGRRVSEFDEVVDGGYGIGSAAPIADGAQPLGHAVKARRDGMTYVLPEAPGYDDVEPDLWFYNEESARRAGFTPEGE
ncbi:hypothetical protein N865_15720 [Intrasporangium oryzae NRRL B-24470]|uniref:Uncharacterized protein n=1 Tax=Intrasporangium oryzae NRRL B-24470 TaxID=1386089 RepID=W9G6K5_9MICO|nr:hypothetical protein N865_15720 [Intrasporangium oryzae NRRL B-24470]